MQGQPTRAAGVRIFERSKLRVAFYNVILFFASGAVYPVECLPRWLHAFTLWNPETHAISALKSVMFKGASFAAISGDVAFLAAFTIITLLLAGATLKRSL